MNLKKEKLLTLEGYDLRVGWHSYVWYEREKKEKNFGNHFIRSSLLCTWQKYKKFFHSKTPLWLSTMEAKQRRLLGWSNWPVYKDLLIKGSSTLKSHEEVKQKFTHISWLHYMQIKEQYNKDREIGFCQSEQFWDKILGTENKIITKIYNKLLEWSTEEETVKNCMIKWADNLRRPITLAEWESIWTKKLKYTYAMDLKENWLKMFHRWYITPKKLNQMYRNTQKNCWKCEEQEGSYFHMWWTCKETKKYWEKVHIICQQILKVHFPRKAEYYLLGITDRDIHLDTNDDILFIYLTTAARISFAKRWKQKETPNMEEWLQKVREIKDMDKLTFLLKKNTGSPIKFTDWSKVEDFERKRS
uniref:Reverse transcriptase zinc-binding domain-containing protein n=1 Tax=Anolis carolinensis TaxID=28377 RepID=G1KVN4_ANOCA